MFDVIERLVNWCINHRLLRAANIYPPSHMKTSIIDKMIVIRENEFFREVFDNDLDAAKWLTQEGFPTCIEKPCI